MITIFSGDQTQYREYIETLKKKHNFDSMYFASASELANTFFDEMSQETLFGTKYLASVDGLGKAVEFSNIVIERIESLKVSPHMIVLFDDEGLLIDFASEHDILVSPKASKEKEDRGVNPFVISDSIFSRDKKSTWLTYHSLLGSGLSPREIHTVLFWAFKAVSQAKNAKTAEAAGLKPFVFSKVRKGNWSETEVATGLSSLAKILHTASFDDEDFSFALERFILQKV